MKTREAMRRLRMDVISKYGSRCVCCGESEIKFLAMDHIHGGGKAHRKKIGGHIGFYRWLVRNNYPDDFRILCHNCNHGRELNGGICPHEEQQDEGVTLKRTTSYQFFQESLN